VIGQHAKEPSRNSAPVRSPVQGQVVPPVGVRLAERGREVRRVGEDKVEASQAIGQVGPYHVHVGARATRLALEIPERVRVAVRRDDATAGPGRLERDRAGACADLEDEPSARPPREGA
jgi:hypothetical protein